MYFLTLKGQGQKLTSVHMTSGSSWVKIDKHAYHSTRLDELNTLSPRARLYLFSVKSYWQKTMWPQLWPDMTLIQLVHDQTWALCARLVKTRRMICILAYLDCTWPWGHVTLGQMLTLAFQGSKYTKLDAPWREELDGVRIIALAFSLHNIFSINQMFIIGY